MINEEPPSSFAAEAADMETDPARLADLARYPMLAPLVAENPSTRTETLMNLYALDIPNVRRGIARNPGAPMDLLFKLAREYPADFLQNPLLPMLNLTQPNFAKSIPAHAWIGILRCEEIPSFWFKVIKADNYFQRFNAKTWEIMQMHVAMAGEAPDGWREVAGMALKKYQKNMPKASPLSHNEEFALFILFVLLFPLATPMVKARWDWNTRASANIRDNIQLALAAGVPIDRGGLKVLARKPDVSLQVAVARHAMTPTRILAHLSKYGSPAVRGAVAGNPQTPGQNIARLLTDAHAMVRRRAVTHPAVGRQDFGYLQYDEDATVRAAIAGRHGLDASIYTRLSCDAAYQVRRALARNVQVSQEILRLLAHDGEPEVRAAAASNPRLPLDLLAGLSRDDAEIVRAGLGSNARLSSDSAEQFLHDQSLMVRKALAANPRTPIALLDALLHTEEMTIWQGLVRHPRLEPAQLIYLAEHGDIAVRSAVAAHKRTPLEVLERLARENRRELWQGLVTNPHTPLPILKRAIETEDYKIWFSVMNHPAMMQSRGQPFVELLQKKLRPLLIENTLPAWFRKAVLQYYTSLPVAIVEIFAESPSWEERYLVARYPYATAAVLETLAHDGNRYVRAAARVALRNAR
ncbi:hypothetical protein [Dictyobacter kobayashii]|uniref:Leucine rich repeat variant n=1 Tax=Dictyobacter kobayashii TaxID=2014872 RepID=A0A402AZ58_9CHLR|nr:hypothetical protein [Dictyobacter kobayashii]GCE24401.1 hypothetical protein KDK_82010 [Dictyobacter kobayashii]